MPLVSGNRRNAGPTILFTDELERNLSFIVDKIKTRKLILNVHPFVTAYLKKGYSPNSACGI